MGIIIVHYKTPKMLRECVESVLPELSSADRVIVVDNASGAEHLVALREAPDTLCTIDERVRLIASDRNLGFAGANNVGIRALQEEGGCEQYMLLNPDTIVRERAFQTLQAFLDAHPEAACVGPRLEFPNAAPQVSAFGDPTPMSELVRGANIGFLSHLLKRWEVYGEITNHAHPCDWLAGACVLIRREVIDNVGLLDDDFFMYYEEVDYFRRARKAGFQCWYEPAAHVVHLVGQSSGVTTEWSAKRLPAYWFESRHRYFRKHFGYLGMVAADAAWMIGHTIMRIRRLLTGVSHSAVAKKEPSDLLLHSMRQIRHPFTMRKEAQAA